ncbi:MAG: endo alpha-1,4 polygalactosaminidase [Polyangiaceae bacterium]
MKAVALATLGVALVACDGGGGTGSGGASSAASTTSTSSGTASSMSTASSMASGSSTSTSSSMSSSMFQPTPLTDWQWQLSGAIDTSVDVGVYDVDMIEATDADFAKLKADGRKIICYFSAGSYEPYRPDADKFAMSDLGNELVGWPGERWLDTRSAAVRDIMKARLDVAKARGCDAVEPDNVDGYSNDSGFPLTAATQLDFNQFIAAEAHARGLSVGLKNDLDQVAELAPFFDWALNEECVQYDECGVYSASFIAANKAVFHAEYVDASELANVCAITKPLKLSTLVKNLDLDAYRLTCP